MIIVDKDIPADVRVVLCVSESWPWYPSRCLHDLLSPYAVEVFLATPQTDPNTIPWLRLRLVLAFGPASHNWLKSRLALCPFAEYLRLPALTKVFGTSFLLVTEAHKGAIDLIQQMVDRLFPPATAIIHECPLEELPFVDIETQYIQALRLREDLIVPVGNGQQARVALDQEDVLTLRNMMEVWQTVACPPILVGVYDAAGLPLWKEENDGGTEKEQGYGHGYCTVSAGAGAVQTDSGGSESELQDWWEDDEGVDELLQD